MKSKVNFHLKMDIRMPQLRKALAGKIRQLTVGPGWKVEALSGVGLPYPFPRVLAGMSVPSQAKPVFVRSWHELQPIKFIFVVRLYYPKHYYSFAGVSPWRLQIQACTYQGELAKQMPKRDFSPS